MVTQFAWKIHRAKSVLRSLTAMAKKQDSELIRLSIDLDASQCDVADELDFDATQCDVADELIAQRTQRCAWSNKKQTVSTQTDEVFISSGTRVVEDMDLKDLESLQEYVQDLIAIKKDEKNQENTDEHVDENLPN